MLHCFHYFSSVEDKSGVNPGVAKQVLMGGAKRLPTGANIFEQGAGKVDLLASYRILATYKPQITYACYRL